jgi:sigma-B regulation protein RsbU (phosphoserine phosphatase)
VFNATERRRYERELLAAKELAGAERERSRRLSATLQSSIRPSAALAVPGLTVAAAYHPAGDGSVVGGDFYDCFQLADGDWLAVLGDVAGKGPEAAIITTLVRYSLRGLAAVLSSPQDLLTHLNQILFEHRGDRFCTVVVLRLQQQGENWRVTLASGGHPPAILLSGTGAMREIRPTGPLVGALRSAAYTEHELALAPGESLLLYTDGVTEARGRSGFYGDGRLRAACGTYGPEPTALVEGLLADVLTHQDGLARDDIAILALGLPHRER